MGQRVGSKRRNGFCIWQKSNSREITPTPWLTLGVDLPRSALAILPPTLLWGASFPLALAAAGRAEDDAARLVGRLYAATRSGRSWARPCSAWS